MIKPHHWNCKLRREADPCGCNISCRNCATVSEVKCNNTGKVCMGDIQQKFEAMMQQCFRDLSFLVSHLSHVSNTLWRNFQTQFHLQKLRPKTLPATLLNKETPSMCAKEELQFKNNQDPPHDLGLVNSNKKIKGHSRHDPKFRSHAMQTTLITDGSTQLVQHTKSWSTNVTICNACLADMWLEALRLCKTTNVLSPICSQAMILEQFQQLRVNQAVIVLWCLRLSIHLEICLSFSN